MKPPEWYDVIRYHIVPPVFLVVFTGAVQYLALVGQGETNITWRLAASKALCNSFSWGCVALFSLWAILWLQLPAGQVYGPPTLFGHRPPYQVLCQGMISTPSYTGCLPNASTVLGIVHSLSILYCIGPCLHNEELHDLYSSPSIVRVIKQGG
jgi:hypothetical protein